MIRNTALAAVLAAAIPGGVAWVPAVQAQNIAPRMMCVEFSQVSWTGARVTVNQVDATGNTNELLSVVTTPTRRCAHTARSPGRVRFAIEAHENGAFRLICRAETVATRDATLRVVGNAVGASCTVFE